MCWWMFSFPIHTVWNSQTKLVGIRDPVEATYLIRKVWHNHQVDFAFWLFNLLIFVFHVITCL